MKIMNNREGNNWYLKMSFNFGTALSILSQGSRTVMPLILGYTKSLHPSCASQAWSLPPLTELWWSHSKGTGATVEFHELEMSNMCSVHIGTKSVS